MRSIRGRPEAAFRRRERRTGGARPLPHAPIRERALSGCERRLSLALAWVPALSALAAIANLPGCREPLAAPIAAAHGDDPTPRRGGVLRLAASQDLRTLDPAGPADSLGVQAQQLLFAGLVDLDDQSRVVPDLALGWQVEDGGKTYRFALRTGCWR